MSRHNVDFTLTIASGQTESDAYSTRAVVGRIIDLTIWSPAVLSGTVSVRLNNNKTPASGTWAIATLNGTAITVPVSRAVVVPIGSFRAIQLQSDGAEGADRVFQCIAQVDM